MPIARSVISMWLAASWAAVAVAHAASTGDFTMSQVLDYPKDSELAAAAHADVIAWVRTVEGVRNIWIARGPDLKPARVTHYQEDDGQEITQLTFSPDGDAPAISARGELAYTQDDHVWSAPVDGKPERLFFDRGKDSDLRWSPDSSRLAFVRQPGDGGPPEPILTQVPHPWSLWVSPSNGGAALHWAAGDRLVFLANLDDWPHLYSVPAAGGEAMLLTPGAYMVGGSHGGYLTALALARNSDLFKAGVDLHGVHDWSRLLDAWVGKSAARYEKGDREQALKVAWESSPDAGIDAWRSPVLPSDDEQEAREAQGDRGQ